MDITKNIRFYIFVFSAFLAVLIYLWITITIPGSFLQTIRMEQFYALAALSYLYLTMLIGPVLSMLYSIPFKEELKKSRRAMGVSAFFFGLLHSSLAFFGQLGGFPGLFFLDNKFLLAISLSFIALLILALLTLTSFDFVIEKITFYKWKKLQRLVYLAAVLILTHALMLGTHFSDLSTTIPQIFFLAFSILAFLEAIRVDSYIKKRFAWLPSLGVSTLLSFTLITVYALSFFIPESSTLSLGIHSQHILLAKQAQDKNNNIPNNLGNNPALQGDVTKRYTVSFDYPENPQANQDSKLTFKIYDAANGNPVSLYSRVYEKVLHLIVVDQELKYFNHIHPDQTSEGFTITTQFPHEGRYHLYSDFQPLGAIEQQIGVTLDVGKVDQTPTVSTFQPDTNLSKVFGSYKVTLSYPTPLKSSEISVGNQKLRFSLMDAATNQPITNLKPYLAAFGHLVMINTTSFEYIHVHPTNLVAPKPEDSSGPDVEFMPLGLYGPIKPGIYRVFAQFNPGGNLITTDYTIKIEE